MPRARRPRLGAEPPPSRLAVRALRRLIRGTPEWATLHFDLGVLLSMQEFEAALGHLEMAVQLRPER